MQITHKCIIKFIIWMHIKIVKCHLRFQRFVEDVESPTAWNIDNINYNVKFCN